MRRTLVWLQRNLRMADNPSLQWALAQGGEVVLLYLHSPLDEIPWQPGGASLWWLQQSLKDLQHCLAGQGLALNLLSGVSHEQIPQLIARHQIDAVCWQRNYAPHLAHRDQDLARQLSQQGITVKIFNDGLLADPNRLLTQQGTPYRVFTPFYKQLRKTLMLDSTVPADNPTPQTVRGIRLPESLTLEQLALLAPHAWQTSLAQHNQPGEAQAWQRLEYFIYNTMADYPSQRDFPAVDGTSQLSAALHFGEISTRQISHALLPIIEQGNAQQAAGAESFLRQLIWREFARYILWHFPATSEQLMDQRFVDTFWQYDSDKIQRWQRGETGVPIIDAGMRQLWQSGTMHNRVRMLAASYLTKNLGQPWQIGARWFWDTLVDADLANNSLGWQWVAGCGVDAAPYFRIFNPYTQAQKFDHDGHYQQRWLGDSVRPQAMVEIDSSRREALARYQQHIKGRNTP